MTGDVVELFGQLQISARMFAVDGELEAEGLAATAQGSTDEYFAVIDDLTRQLLLHAVGPAGEYDRLAARTTDSLSALKAYLEGAAELRAERYRSAFAAFQRAVRIDSTFALAWYGMFWAGAWPGLMEWEQAVEATRQAVRYSGRLPPRVQEVLKANSAIIHGDLAEGERLSRAVLTRYPNYPDAWYALGFALWHWNPFHGRPISEAFVTYKRCLSLEPDNSHFQYAGALIAALEGDWSRFDSLTRVVETRPEMALSWRAIRAFGAGSEAEQTQVLAEASQLADWQPLPAGRYVALFAGDIAGGAELVSLAILDSLPLEARGIARVQVAEFMLAVGGWRAAQHELAQVATFNPTLATLYRALWATSPWVPTTRSELSALHDSVASWDASSLKPSVTHTGTRAHDLLGPQLRLYVLGRLSVRLGDHESALGYADQLEQMVSPRRSPSYGFDRAQTIRATVLRDRGRLAEALELLGSQMRRLNIQYLFDAPFYVHPEERFLHGEIMVGLERYEEALRWYETAGQVGFGEPSYVAMAHLRRAEVYERLGDTKNAARQYEKFIRYWQDADPEFQPWVGAARRALERLSPDA